MHLWWQALDGVAGGLNIAYGAVDRHVVHGRSACAVRVLRRQRPRDGELLRKTIRFANALRAFGAGAGDTVFTLLGRCPALYVASRGALKVDAVFSPLFSAR